MTEKPLIDKIVIPEAEIKIVLDWIKSEQVRTIQIDRTFGSSRNRKVDYLTETSDNIVSLIAHAKYDNSSISMENSNIEWRNKRDKQLAAEEEAKAKHCASFVKCTCERAF